jgi:subtilase-type serine protease
MRVPPAGVLRSRLLQSVAVVIAATAASVVDAHAQSANLTPANVNVLNLLSPFLNLNLTAAGQETLQVNLSQSLNINNNVTLTDEQRSISDKSLMNAASNSITLANGMSMALGPAANLAGGLPMQAIQSNPGMPGTVVPNQPDGGLGQLGSVFQTGVSPSAPALPNTVKLLVNTYNFTSSDLGAAKLYLANGTTDGTTPAVAPPGFTLPKSSAPVGGQLLPNMITSVYDHAYGVTNGGNGQDTFGNSRPVQVAPNSSTAQPVNPTTVFVYDPTALNGLATNPANPSGHTNYAFTDSYLLAMLAPQAFQNMLSRASQFANSRIQLGVHYPLDIIESRSFSAYDLAQAFTNPSYINNAATTGPFNPATQTGTAIDLPSLFNAANGELLPYLAAHLPAGCSSVSACVNAGSPLAPSAANLAAYTANLTYGLPTLSFTAAPREAAPAGGPDASILLATVYGGSRAAAMAISPTGGILGNLQTSTINQIIVNTETNALSAFNGTPLSYWSRINLYTADGYFQNLTGVLTLAKTDQVKTDVTVASNGVLGGEGTIVGNLVNLGTVKPGDAPGVMTVTGDYTQPSGGTLEIMLGGTTPGTQYSQLLVDGEATLTSELDLTLVNGFDLATGQTFDIVGAGDGLTNDLTSLALNGHACGAVGDAFKCFAGSFFDIFTTVTLDPGSLVPGANPMDLQLEVTVVPTAEPSTWVMMGLGFAGLAGAAGYRRKLGVAVKPAVAC